ncbi:MAG: hypothetical protein HZA08_07810 [Nitrospirae bacterium]|nr:hypothetical protein [Nitrospirota bacterium]
MKTWTVKTVVSPNHKVAFDVPDDIPEGPVEIVIVIQPMTEGVSLRNLGWTESQANETRARLKSFEEDWNAPGMDAYDVL